MLSEKERLDAAIDSVVGIVMFDRSGTVVASNEVFRRVTGYTREEIQSGKLTWRTFTPPEWVHEKEYRLKDGSRRWMLFDGRRMDDDLIVECCVDITGRRMAELAAKQSEERRRALLAELAHELNNPLQIVVTALEVLRSDHGPESAIDAIADAIRRLSDLSHRLMETVSAGAENNKRQR
jgi:PAS domain-containing protein